MRSHNKAVDEHLTNDKEEFMRRHLEGHSLWTVIIRQ